jgi:hypothetical protein
MRLRSGWLVLVSLAGCTVDNPAFLRFENAVQPDGQVGNGDQNYDGAPTRRDTLLPLDDAARSVADAALPTFDATQVSQDGAVTSIKASSFFDDFEGSALSPSWQASVAGNGCTVALGTGALRFRMNGPAGLCTVRSTQAYDIQSDAVSFQIPPITNFYAPIWFFIFIESGQQRFEYGFVNDTMEVQLLALPFRTASWTMGGVYRPQPTYWRIRADTDNLYFEHSVDATAWTATATHPAPFSLSEIHVGVGAEIRATIPGIVGIGVSSYNR